MIKKEIDGFTYQLFDTGDISKEKISDYIYIINRVFHSNMSEQDFFKKFIDNIYGESFIVIVYDRSKPIACRAMWRNDIESKKAFQPCDTAVCEEYRGNGIFGNMTELALEPINTNIIYNYPNNNSKQLYLRNGWKIYKQYYLNIFTSNQKYLKLNGDYIDDNYAFWRFNDRSDVYKFKYRNTFYLIRKRTSNCFIIIGRVSQDYYAKSNNREMRLGIVLFRSEKRPFYKSSCICSVTRNPNVSIPLYKMDAM